MPYDVQIEGELQFETPSELEEFIGGLEEGEFRLILTREPDNMVTIYRDGARWVRDEFVSFLRSFSFGPRALGEVLIEGEESHDRYRYTIKDGDFQAYRIKETWDPID